ncbi:MAG TPA: MGMT family protein [Methylomirabilota bacterium]|nr:MGMT family protein [Methylomirabilota bacterium]
MPAQRGGAPDGKRARPDAFAKHVLAVVALIPPGRVLTYADVCRLVGERSPRQVGQVMARWGSRVPWHRVVFADGAYHSEEALPLLRAEGVPWRGGRVDLRRARWDRGTPGP